MPLYLSYTMVQKSQKWPKTQIKGGGPASSHLSWVTDNRRVTFLKSKSGLSKREARWVEFLADFDVTIIHRPGRENIADSLSRLDHSDVDCSREGPEKMFDSAQASKPESFQTADVTMSEPDGQLWSSEVSILLEPDWKQQLVEDYAKDRKMKHLIERLKKIDGLQSSYRWNAKEGHSPPAKVGKRL